MEAFCLVSSDTIVGIVGAVILTGAMVAVFYYEADREDPGTGGIGSGAERFEFTFSEERDRMVETSGSLEEGASWTQELTLPAYSFALHVEVDWSHALQGSPLLGDHSYTIEILDRDADGAVVASTSSSPLHHEMEDDMAAPPSLSLTVSADSEEEAHGFMAEHMQSDEVRHNERHWTLRITLEDDGMDVPDLTGEGQWSFDVEMDVYHLTPRLAE
jgi:hypothetical protein